jgi:endonuclease/exonuclease/phosphatase family metal-dependent hydrolase
VVIRTWNVFHGNTEPTQRRAFLRLAVRLAVSGNPDVVCLQELPAWALGSLGTWSGYTAVPALAQPPMLGPLRSSAQLGRLLSSAHNGLLRSAFSGQGNAILVAPGLRVESEHACVLNSRGFRRAQARWLGLGAVARIAWSKERRMCQVVRLRDGERTFVVANLHATGYRPDLRLGDAELLRAFVYVDGIARPGEPVAIAGDFNQTFERSRTLLDVTGSDWGFSRAGPGIDHVVVRGLRVARGPERWRRERRTLGGALLSDHDPVEIEVA